MAAFAHAAEVRHSRHGHPSVSPTQCRDHTALVLRGEAEFAVAFLHVQLGLPMEQASGTVEVFAKQALGCDPGSVPDGWQDWAWRVCPRLRERCRRHGRQARRRRAARG